MKKIVVSIILYFFLNVSSFSHLQHYSELNYLEYELFRNNNLIGSHKYDFVKNVCNKCVVFLEGFALNRSFWDMSES